jgi:hypothetical protein
MISAVHLDRIKIQYRRAGMIGTRPHSFRSFSVATAVTRLCHPFIPRCNHRADRISGRLGEPSVSLTATAPQRDATPETCILKGLHCILTRHRCLGLVSGVAVPTAVRRTREGLTAHQCCRRRSRLAAGPVPLFPLPSWASSIYQRPTQDPASHLSIAVTRLSTCQYGEFDRQGPLSGAWW